MKKHKWQLVGLALLTVFVLVGVFVEPSLAGTSNVGKNAGDEAASWAKALIFPIAALVGLPLLLKRDFAAALALLALVMVVGSFIYAPNAVRDITSSIAKAIGG